MVASLDSPDLEIVDWSGAVIAPPGSAPETYQSYARAWAEENENRARLVKELLDELDERRVQLRCRNGFNGLVVNGDISRFTPNHESRIQELWDEVHTAVMKLQGDPDPDPEDPFPSSGEASGGGRRSSSKRS